jgi:hypothetical protein
MNEITIEINKETNEIVMISNIGTKIITNVNVESSTSNTITLKIISVRAPISQGIE